MTTYDEDARSVGDYLITARSLAEYRAMFALTEGDLRGRILDCPGGAASFAAEASDLGCEVLAIDPVYDRPATELGEHALAEAERGGRWSAATADRYKWDFYGDVDGQLRMRTAAAQRFSRDLVAHPERYRAGSLPALDLPDNAFDLVLSSHLLFLYADRLDHAFHLAALTELSRVSAGEVRVFPLLDQAGGDCSAMIGRLRAELPVESEIRRVDFEFLRGAHSMLVLG